MVGAEVLGQRKAAGVPVTVFGGDHADLPLQEHACELIARAIIERRFSSINVSVEAWTTRVPLERQASK